MYVVQNIDGWFGDEKKVIVLTRFLNGVEGLPKTMLLHGPPGCGKTSLVKAVINELGMELVYINSSEEVNKEKIEKLFSILEIPNFDNKKRVLFLDEIDYISTRMKIMKLISGASFPVVLACNYLSKVDVELKDNAFLMELKQPSDDERKKYAKFIIKKLKLDISKDIVEDIVSKSKSYRTIMFNLLVGMTCEEDEDWVQTFDAKVARHLIEGKTSDLEESILMRYLYFGGESARKIRALNRMHKIRKTVAKVSDSIDKMILAVRSDKFAKPPYHVTKKEKKETEKKKKGSSGKEKVKDEKKKPTVSKTINSYDTIFG